MDATVGAEVRWMVRGGWGILTFGLSRSTSSATAPGMSKTVKCARTKAPTRGSIEPWHTWSGSGAGVGVGVGVRVRGQGG